MEKFFDRLFSMRMAALGLVVFLVAIALATFIESFEDIQTARIFIYSATWFNLLLVFLSACMIANIFRYRMYQREKFAMLVFHLSFIVILIGAAITRFSGFEGLMIIPEGRSSNQILLSDPHVWVRIHDNKMEYKNNVPAMMSELAWNDFDLEDIEFPGHPEAIRIEYHNFRKKLIDSLVINRKFKTEVLEFVSGGRQTSFLGQGQMMMAGQVPIAFEKKLNEPGISLFRKDGQLMIKTNLPVTYLRMTEMTKANQSGAPIADSMYRKIPSDSAVVFEPRCLYQIGNEQLVFNRLVPHAKMMKLPSGRKDVGSDRLSLKITDGKQSKIVHLDGGKDQRAEAVAFEFNGLNYEMAYGSTIETLPFSIFCRDFQMTTYPGSETASSYASEVTVVDTANKFERNQRIFMNHVMDYGGYRFFQSSYELDDPSTPQNEEATKLSVNHDFWGTNVTYLGYLLMTLGMIISLFARNGRFRELNQLISKSHARRAAGAVAIILTFVSNLSAQHAEHEHEGHEHEAAPKPNLEFHFMSDEHSEEMASLLVQDFSGRIIPMHTNCDQLLRKVYGSNKYEGHNAVQTIMSMHMYPQYWMTQKVISVPAAVRSSLKLEKHAAFIDLYDENNNQFKWMREYNIAHKKKESSRNEFDKKLIKLVERFEVYSAFFAWSYMRMIPIKGAPRNAWYSPVSEEVGTGAPQAFKLSMEYLSSLHESSKNGGWGQTGDLLLKLKKFQRSHAVNEMPDAKKVAWEISYNKMHIFKNAMYSYLIFGFILLILFFVRTLSANGESKSKKWKRISLPFVILMAVIMAYHGWGLYLRWFISGHAPWSNGYEAIVYIAFITVGAGFVFMRKNSVVLGATAVLAFFMIFVSEMSLLDPEITPLQPVLKSYWLQIHVSVITASYGFLGLGAIISMVNLVLYLLRGAKNGKRLTANINEISYISEMTITIGLFLLTIGTFLGGVWANESWGRYWGWDPKETWALVSVLVYAVVLHLRFIPALSSKFVFNVAALWGYSAILFTFFGVNFVLVGLHSYAQGDGVAELPQWVIYTVIIFILFTVAAAIRNIQYKNRLSHEDI